MDRLQWVLQLDDRLSGPAGKIEKQLGQVRAQLKKLDIAAKENALSRITDPLKKQRVELQLHRDRLLLSKGAMEKHGSAAKAFGDRLHGGREALRDWLLILDPVARAMHFVAGRAEEMGKRILHAVSFKQGSMIGLESMFGAKGGADVFERMARMAGAIGKPTEKLVAMARSLSMVGVAQKDLEPMVRLIEDLDAMQPGGGDALAKTIGGIFSSGAMRMGDVESLSPFMKQEELLKRVGGLFGTPNKFAGRQILDSEFGLQGANRAVSVLLGQVLAMEGGKIGSKSAAGGKTLQGQLDNIETQITRMFGRLSKSGGVKAFGGVLANLVNIFDPDSKTAEQGA